MLLATGAVVVQDVPTNRYRLARDSCRGERVYRDRLMLGQEQRPWGPVRDSEVAAAHPTAIIGFSFGETLPRGE